MLNSWKLTSSKDILEAPGIGYVLASEKSKDISTSTAPLFNTTKGKLIHTLEGHKEAVTSVAFSPDGEFFASGSKDQTVKIWKVNNGELNYTFEKI